MTQRAFMTWPCLPLRSRSWHLSHPTLNESTLAGLHFPKHVRLLLRSCAFSCSLSTSDRQGFFCHSLLCWCYALSFYVLILMQSFNKIPELVFLARNCLLVAIPLFITSCYTGALGHFTHTLNSTGLKPNSLFPYICFFSIAPYPIQVPSSQLFSNMEAWVFTDSSISHPNTKYSSSSTDYIPNYIIGNIIYSHSSHKSHNCIILWSH